MKSSRNFLLKVSSRKVTLRSSAVVTLVIAAGWMISASGSLTESIRNLEARTVIESAFFRMMSLPGGNVLFRRAPRETRPALAELIHAQPRNAELYSLRALEDEQQLDFSAAESDWKLYAENASDKTSAQMALADFYHRRLRPLEEIKALAIVANAPADSSENLTPIPRQNSWRARERIFRVIQEQGLGKDQSVAQYRAWLARYPQEQALYTRFLEFLIAEKDYAAAGQLIADYHKQFPSDEIFPVKAQALVEYRQGSMQRGLAVYEQSFQPLWSPELVKSYFDLLTQTQNLRKFLDQARARLNANPEDLNAMARVFYYYQQQGKLEAAQQVIADFRAHKESTKLAWTGQELFTCARLLQEIHAYPESARYYFALYNSTGMQDAQEIALVGLTNLLLTAPESPIRLGTGELSMYRDIATLDQGPGYLNGILSLLLNTTAPAMQYSEEDQRAVPYFHRSRAAELLALLDTKFPNSARRPELHAKLLDFYAGNGESNAVIQGGREFLASFPNAAQRTTVALLMADAYARTRKNQDEFAIYDSVLQELAGQSQNVPLGASERATAQEYSTQDSSDAGESGEDNSDGSETPGLRSGSQAFQVKASSSEPLTGPRSPEYSRVLERYLARLVELKQIPEALAVLRREIDRNPNDPGLYERLATFLEQNRLGAEQEEVYRRAMARFPEKSWYDKLARFYLRYQKNAEFEQLTQEAIKTFHGTELERYFNQVVNGGSPALYLRLNQYANQRFPHYQTFVRNLLSAYHARETYDQAAWEALLRQHWFEETGFRDQFFEYLSSTYKLDAELAALQQENPAIPKKQWNELVRGNPAAGEYLAQAELWRSHFEQSAPVLKALAEEYPADPERVHTASAVYRSLAYFDPEKLDVAAKLEDNLLQASPGDGEILARIGDIYADRDLFGKAAPYWDRIPQAAPGQSNGYLDAATIYWDYFDFDNALRLLHDGRKKLRDDSLFSYEAGAIYENQRDYSQAIAEYAKGALAGTADSQAEYRLLALARRPKFRDLTDQATAQAAALPNPSTRAMHLRVRVLEAQDRKQEMESYLDSVLNSTTSIEQAEDIENLAQGKSLETVREHALEKQASLTTDPVSRLQLRYALVRLYEGRKDFQSAQRNGETLYHDNPKILGVVRSTVDFYWRMKMYSQAIAALVQASKDAYPALSKQFRFEAARKSTVAAQYPQARELLAGLLQGSPYDGQYLAALADTYAQAGDDRGLQQFYIEKITLFRNAPLSAEERKTQIATLRRGLIPVLTRMKEYSGAVDQYIELINAFPEDDGLTTEAALYALRYQRQPQLLDFYSKTVTQSPRNYRWPMVLARVQSNLEDFPAAIDTYAKAIAIRPDRVELRIARAELEERLLRFDDAASDYDRIYQLAYKDPKWMEKVAEVHARQGKTDAVVAALKTALIDGRPEHAGKYFEVARRLESWGMLQPALSFAEQGVTSAGSDLLANSEQQGGARIYVSIMTRLRRQEKAYATLQSALDAASSNLPVIEQQIAQQGIAALTNSEWRERTREARIRTAREGLRSALREMGNTVATYFTPEEKVAFAHFAETKRTGMNFADTDMFAVTLAQSAELAELEARWRYELMMAAPPHDPSTISRMHPLIDLQRRRAKFAELAGQLEQFAAKIPPVQRSAVWTAAASAYRSAGDSGNEPRVLAKMPLSNMGTNDQQRLLTLLLARRPKELAQRASNWDYSGQTAADYTVANGDAALAHLLVSSRGANRPPVWNKSYDALVGLYFSENTPQIHSAFVGALGDATIAERLAKPVDRSQQLAGNIWFYYGSRYGEYLGVTKQGAAEDFLPAVLEESPGTASGYVTVADYYADHNDTGRAIADYSHALELAPARVDVLDRLALAYYKQGARAEALAQWKQAFVVLTAQINSPRVPESFWADFGRVCDHLSTRKLFTDLKPDTDTLLRTYLRRNGNYRSNALLHSAYAATSDPAAATIWILDLALAAQDPTTILADLVDMPWIPLAQRAPIYQRILETRQDTVLKSQGTEKEYALQNLRSWQVRWVQYLVKTKQYTQAADSIAAFPKETRNAEAASLVPLELQVVAQLKTLDSKIAAYRANPQAAPGSEILRTAARQISETGDKQSARKILEFVFAREIEDHRLVATNFLGLAEIRIAAGDTPGALELLRRLTVAVGNPFENLDPAAALLEKTGHNAEAVEFLKQLVKSVPWEPQYRIRLAKAQIAAGKDVASSQNTLAAIAASTDTAYTARTEAALSLHGARPANLGSAELNLLAANSPIPAAAANQPFFYEARLKAAPTTGDRQTKIDLLSGALADAPLRDDARVPLFQAAQGQANEFALGALEPLLRQNVLMAAVPAEEEEVLSGGEDSSGLQSGPAYSSLKLSAAQLAWDVGNAMLKLNRLHDALPYLQFAHKTEKTPARHQQITAQLADTRAQLRRQQANTARQPILHEALDQDRVVRPRLLARTSVPTRTSGQGKGGVQ